MPTAIESWQLMSGRARCDRDFDSGGGKEKEEKTLTLVKGKIADQHTLPIFFNRLPENFRPVPNTSKTIPRRLMLLLQPQADVMNVAVPNFKTNTVHSIVLNLITSMFHIPSYICQIMMNMNDEPVPTPSCFFEQG